MLISFTLALLAVRREIRMIEEGKLDMKVNPLKKAPHPITDITSDKWDRPYPRAMAAYPLVSHT